MLNHTQPTQGVTSKRVRIAVAGVILAVSAMWTHIAAAQQYKQITRLGTSQAMCSGGVETLSELQDYVRSNPDAFAAVVQDSGAMVSAQAVVDAVMAGDVSEVAYPVGTRMAWMGAKVKGNYQAMPYREWAGKQSFEAFSVSVSSDCRVYELAIPKQCCNLSLVAVSADTSSACVAPAAAPAAAAPVADPVAASDWLPYVGVFAGTETRPRYEPAWDMDKRDSSGIKGLRAGIMKKISDKNAVFTQVSVYDRDGVNGGNIYPEDNVALDVGLERQLSRRAFIGGGIGIWNIDDGDYRDGSLFAHVGGNFGESRWQWLLEGRVFDSDSDNLDSLSSNRMFSLGIRYVVK